MTRAPAILASLALASATLATAPIRPTEITARPGRIVSSYDGTPGTGDGWIALDGYLRTTGIYAQVRFEPGRRCRILGVEFVARAVNQDGAVWVVPSVVACPDADYAVTNLTGPVTNWVESFIPWTLDNVQLSYSDSKFPYSIVQTWTHWTISYDCVATSRNWTVWRDGVCIGWSTKRRNTASSWNPDGMFRVWFAAGLGSPATQTELQYFRPFMAHEPLSADAFRRAYMRWKGAQQ